MVPGPKYDVFLCQEQKIPGATPPEPKNPVNLRAVAIWENDPCKTNVNMNYYLRDRDPATLTVAYIKARDRWVRSRPDIGRPSGGASLRDHAGFLSASEVSALAAKLGAELTTEELEMAENH